MRHYLRLRDRRLLRAAPVPLRAGRLYRRLLLGQAVLRREELLLVSPPNCEKKSMNENEYE